MQPKHRARPRTPLTRANKAISDVRQLLQLRVLRLGFPQDGDVGVGVFPEREEVLVLRASLDGVAGKGVGASEAQVRQCADYIISRYSRMVDNLLELGGSSRALMCRRVRLAPHRP